MASTLNERIDAMFNRDRLFATAIVAVLWLTELFVMLAVRQYMPSAATETVCWIAAGVLLLFNTASIFAMLKHYAEDKNHIYGVDIRHIDAGH
jgi:hypothetical protein